MTESKPNVRILEEWKNQVAANDTVIPENYEPLHIVGTKYNQEYDEIQGLGVTVREFKRNKYSIGARYADNS